MSSLCRSGVDRKVLAFGRTRSFLGTGFSKTLKSSRLFSWALFSGQLDETSRVIPIAASDMLDMCCFELWLWLLGRESESAKVWSVKLAEGKQDAACQQTFWIRIFGLEILWRHNSHCVLDICILYIIPQWNMILCNKTCLLALKGGCY